MKKIARLGTRGSPLALVQAQIVRDRMLQAMEAKGEACEIIIVPIRTSGDWKPGQGEQTFLEMGGNKGLFAKEIEEALLAGSIDFAVHSMKDVETEITAGLEFPALLERADPRDAFLSHKATTLEGLPSGATVGTSSLRRQAQILAHRSDLRVVPLRGNVDTRLRKLEEGEADATILAVAGLVRLGMEDRIASIMDVEAMLPSAAQGAIGVQIRQDDAEIRAMAAPLNHAPTMDCVTAERAFLKVLDGSCRTPVAALAWITPDHVMKLDALVASPDGATVFRMQQEASPADAVRLGTDLGHALRKRMPPGFLAA